MLKSSIRQFWGFFVSAFKGLMRTPSAIFFGFFFPLVFIFSFAFVGGNGVKFDLGLVSGNQPQFAEFNKVLKSVDIFNIQEDSKANLQDKLKKGDLDGFIEFEDNNSIVLTLNSSRQQNSQVIKQTIGTLVDKYTLQTSDVDPIFELKEKEIEGRNNKYINFVLPGILGFSLLSSAVTGTSFSFVSLKKTFALKRLFAAPSKSSMFILGQSLARLVFAFLQNLLLLIVAVGLFGFSPVNGIISLIQMLVVILIGLILFLGMGYVIAGLATNEDQVAPVTNLITLPQFLLAGTFFSISTLPTWLQGLSKMLPLYNFNEAMRYISLDGLNLTDFEVYSQLGYLLIWTAVTYFVASKVFKVNT